MESPILKPCLLALVLLFSGSCQLVSKNPSTDSFSGSGGTTTGNAVVRIVTRVSHLEAKLEFPFIRTAHAENFSLDVCVESVRFIGAGGTASTSFLLVKKPSEGMAPGTDEVSLKDVAVPPGSYRKVELKVRQSIECSHALRVINAEGVFSIPEITLVFDAGLDVQLSGRKAYEAVLDFKPLAQGWRHAASASEVASFASSHEGLWVNRSGERYTLNGFLAPYGTTDLRDARFCIDGMQLYNVVASQWIDISIDPRFAAAWSPFFTGALPQVMVPQGTYNELRLSLGSGCFPLLNPLATALIKNGIGDFQSTTAHKVSFHANSSAGLVVGPGANVADLFLQDLADELNLALDLSEIDSVLSQGFGRFSQ